MLFNDTVLFLHAPKTAGMAITQFLTDNLPGPVILTEPLNVFDPSVRLPAVVRAKLEVKRVMMRVGVWYPRHVKVMEGKRHERLDEARDMLAQIGRGLEDFRRILAVVRNPYDLEVSRYHFLRLGYHGVRGVTRGREQQLAMELNFEQFAIRAGYAGRNPARIEEWYEIDGRMPDNMRILRFETLEDDLRDALSDVCSAAVRLPHVNTTDHAPYKAYLTPRAENAIFRKYRWLFDRGFYPREPMKMARRGVA